MGEFNVNKSTGGLEQTAGMPSEYPATQVMMSDGVTSVEEALDEVNSAWETVTLPFTPRETGILLCLMRCNSQGRAYITLNGATVTIVDGYNVGEGYVSGIVGVTKNVQVSQLISSNVRNVSFSYKSL